MPVSHIHLVVWLTSPGLSAVAHLQSASIKTPLALLAAITHGSTEKATITYCLSGGKLGDAWQPSFCPHCNSAFWHYDIISRESNKLNYELVSVDFTVESLGSRWVLSGPCPTMTKSSEHFRQLFSLHQWMENLSLPLEFAQLFCLLFDSLWDLS